MASMDSHTPYPRTAPEGQHSDTRPPKQTSSKPTTSVSPRVPISRGLPKAGPVASAPLIPLRQSQVWAKSNPAWSPVPVGSVLGVGLWLLALLLVLTAVFVSGQVPDVASPLEYAIAGYADTPAMAMLITDLPPVQYVAVVPVFLLVAATLGLVPTLWLVGLALAAQLLAGISLFPNMGQVLPLSVGPLWAYALGLPCGVAVMARGLTRSRWLKRRIRRPREPFQLPMASSGGQVIRMKRESRRAGRSPHVVIRVGRLLLRWVRQTAVLLVKGYRLALVLLRPPRQQTVSVWRWACQVLVVSVVGVLAVHGIGMLGTMVWLIGHQIPVMAWEDWMTWPANMALYDIVLTTTFALWIRPLRWAFRWLVY